MVEPGVDVESARRSAAEAARSAGVSVRTLSAMHDLEAVADLFDGIWSTSGAGGRPARPPMSVEHMRALSYSGSFVAGAFGGSTMVAACVAFLAEPIGQGLHSDVTGVSRDYRTRGVGFALKLYQRSWALERGLTQVFWTFDPLVSRNAHFNLTRLGASVDAYLVDFYGDMSDAINQGQGSDRLHACWQLADPSLDDLPSDGRIRGSGHGREGPALLSADAVGGPVVEGPNAEARLLRVAVPPDIEQLRRDDPQLARRWRHAVRETLGAELAAGGRIVGFDRAVGYLVERAASS